MDGIKVDKFKSINSEYISEIREITSGLIENKIEYFNKSQNPYIKAEIEGLTRVLKGLNENQEYFHFKKFSASEKIIDNLVPKIADKALEALKIGDVEEFNNLIKP